MRQKFVENLSLLLLCGYLLIILSHCELYILSNFPSLIDIPVEALLVILCISCQV